MDDYDLEISSKYGIKKEYQVNGVRLPTRFPAPLDTLRKETESLANEIRQLYRNTRMICPGYIMIQVNEGFIAEPEGIKQHLENLIYRGTTTVFAEFTNLTDNYVTLHYLPIVGNPFSLRGRAMIDTILRKTSLGQRLTKYWIENEGITESEAKKRLQEMTPRSP